MCGRDGLTLAVYAELLEDVAQVRADGLATNRQSLCDPLLRQTLGDEAQHLDLAWTQRVLRFRGRCNCGACRFQATGERADACDQLAEVKRLAHIIVAAKVEAGDLVVAFGAGTGEEDDANATPISLAKAAANVITRHGRHLQVEQDNSRLRLPRGFERSLSACHRTTSVTRFAEDSLRERSERRVVINDQNAAVTSQPGSILVPG